MRRPGGVTGLAAEAACLRVIPPDLQRVRFRSKRRFYGAFQAAWEVVDSSGGDGAARALELDPELARDALLERQGSRRPAGRLARYLEPARPALERIADMAGSDPSWLPPDPDGMRSTPESFRHRNAPIPVRDLPLAYAEVGPKEGPTALLHGHLDVVPGREGQVEPRAEGDRLYGRGAYDMKGSLAAMMCALRDLAEQDEVRIRFVCVPDEESEDIDTRSIDDVVRGGFGGDFAITGEPTGLHVGIQAKGVLACRIVVRGRSGVGGIYDVFRRARAAARGQRFQPEHAGREV